MQLSQSNMQETNLHVLHDVCETGNHNLQDDLNDFLAPVSVDQVLTIALDYLANESEVEEFVTYLQCDEFHKIISVVEDLQEFKDVSITTYEF
jgi:hypothetical protein